MRLMRVMIGVALLTALAPAVQPVQAQADEAPALEDVVRYVPAADARAMAVHDERGILVVAHVHEGAGRLSVFALDDLEATGDGNDEEEQEQQEEQGDNGAAEALLTLDLPRADALAKHAHAPLALTFHPELPVLYVWRDIAEDVEIEADSDAEAQVFEHLDHLLIYQLEGEGEQLNLARADAFCHGERFAYAQQRASLAVSGDGERLFLPNMVDLDEDIATQNQGAIGYFDLDEQGMPAPVPVPIEGTLDGYGINEYEMEIRAEWVYTGVPYYNRPRWVRLNRLPTGTGFFAPTKRTLIFGSGAGFGLWDTVDRRGALSEVSLIDIKSPLLVGHPTLPMLYVASHSGNRIAHMPHVHGFPTMVPTVDSYPGTSFRAIPVVLHRPRHVLAIGGRNHLRLVGLDANGAFTDQRAHVPVPTEGPVLAVACSPQRGRIYVAADELP
ncbi:MAG: hypothetical protein ACODAQ_04190 [Phycisphaeraceae bacterium]